MATPGVSDLINDLTDSATVLSEIDFNFSGGTFSFNANAISSVSVSIEGVTASGPSIAIQEGTMIYGNGIDGKGGALLNFGYLGVDNIVATNAVFSGNVAVAGDISANGSTVVTAKDLEGLAESIDGAFKSLAEALTLMCGAIKLNIQAIKTALEKSNAAINKANAAIKAANNAIKKVDEVARAAIKRLQISNPSSGSGTTLMSIEGYNADGDKVTVGGNWVAVASSTHKHVINISVNDNGNITGGSSAIGGPTDDGTVSGSNIAAKSYVDNNFYKKTEVYTKTEVKVLLENLQNQITTAQKNISSLSNTVSNIKSCTCSDSSNSSGT